MVRRLIYSNKTTTIHTNFETYTHATYDWEEAAHNGKGSNIQIYFNPARTVELLEQTPYGTVEYAKADNFIVLGHELIHAERGMRGARLSGTDTWTFKIHGESTYRNPIQKREELATVGLKGNRKGDITENDLRVENGIRYRGAYDLGY